MTEKKLIDEQLKQVSGGEKNGEDDHFDEVTKLLKEAADKALAILGNEVGGLWDCIKEAEKEKIVMRRKVYIQHAISRLKFYKDSLNLSVYHYIKDRLDKSYELTR